MKPARTPTTRMLGCAEYTANWIDGGTAVRLVARGFLPCANHHAQLEKRATPDGASLTELVFYTQESREETFSPFVLETIVLNECEDESLFVLDALGLNNVHIEPAIEQPTETTAELQDSGQHMVYCRPAGASARPEACFMVPVGTKVLPIYRSAFGPAGKPACAEFIAAETHPFLEKLHDLATDSARSTGREE